MTDLATWLRAELERLGWTQTQLARYARVGGATVSDILRKGHVPKAETLFHLADALGTSRLAALRAAGYLPLEEDFAEDDILAQLTSDPSRARGMVSATAREEMLRAVQAALTISPSHKEAIELALAEKEADEEV